MRAVTGRDIDPWFSVREMDRGVTIIEEPYHVERVKSYLIEGAERSVLIDTGMGVADLRGLVERLTDRPVVVVNSHAHWDHIGSNHQFDEIWIHEAEANLLDRGVGNAKLRAGFAPRFLSRELPAGVDRNTITFPSTHASRRLVDGDRIELGDRMLEVLHCPGHSPGGIALIDRANRFLFTTDVAYPGLLYVYAPDDLLTYEASLKKLAALATDVDVACPSHNRSPFEPAMIGEMAKAVGEIRAGRVPDWHEAGVHRHDFRGFGVQVWGNPERDEDNER